MEPIINVDAINVLYNVVFWLQPAFWMWFYNYGAPAWIDRLRFVFPVYFTTSALTLILPQFGAFYHEYPYFYVMVFYSSIGVFFAYILTSKYYWGFTHALSIGALVAFTGSFFWEVPYMVRNAFVTGPQWDWLLHPMFLLYVWFLSVTVGWDRNHRVTYITSGIFISVLFMLGWNIPTDVGGGAIWNSPYYLLNRAICTGIVFAMINKSKRSDGC